MPASFKIGYGAIGWMQPMAKVARALRALGVDGIEGFGLSELLPEDQDLGAVLRELGMGFSGAYASGSFVEPERFAHECEKFQRIVARIAEYGGATVVVGGGRDFPGQRKQNWPRFIESIVHLAGLAHSAGVRFGYHPHRGTLVFHPEEIARFVEDTKDAATLVGLTLDSAHLAVGGADVLAAFESYHARTVHVHIKDVAKLDPEAPYAEEDRFVPLGAGTLPLPEVLQGMQDRGYQGWVTVELDASKQPLEDARTSLKNLSRWMKEIGVATRLRV